MSGLRWAPESRRAAKMRSPKNGVSLDEAILKGRQAYERRAWDDAYDAFSQANAAGSLEADDVERLAWSAVLSGRDESVLGSPGAAPSAQAGRRRGPPGREGRVLAGAAPTSLGRVGAGERLACARAAPGGSRRSRTAVECGYLRLPRSIPLHRRRRSRGGGGSCGSGAAIGDRYKDRDLGALGRDFEGRALIRQGRLAEGLRAPRRGDGGATMRRALARRHRADLLRR